MKRWRTHVTAFILSVEAILFGGFGYRAYRYIQQHGKALSGSVVVLHKKSLESLPTNQFLYYFDLAPDQTDSSDVAWLKKPVTYSYNKDGIHGLVNYAARANKGTYRLAVLGDSFAFGLFVNTKDNFSEKLSELLAAHPVCTTQSYEVINFGVPGYDVRYAAERYKRKGDAYHPDAVIWFLQGEDFFLDTDLYLAREEAYKEQLKASGAAERLGAFSEDQFAASKLSYKENLDYYTALDSEGRRQFIAPQVAALELWRETYAPALILVTPAAGEEEYKTLLKTFARSHPNTFYLEISDFETFHPYDYHPNVNGHRKIANAIYQFLTEKQLPCSK